MNKWEQQKKDRLNKLLQIGEKTCTTCKITQPLQEFRFEKYLQKYNAQCKTCYNKKQMRLYARRNKGAYQGREKIRSINHEAIKTGLKECIKCHNIKPLEDYRYTKGYYDRKCNKCYRDIYWETHIRKPKIIKIPKILTEEEIKEKEIKKEEAIKRYKIKARERYCNNAEYRERCKRDSRERHLRDRSIMLARKHKREAKMIELDDRTVTPKIIKSILEERISCPYCGKPIGKVEIDHMDPLSKGGLHSIFNIIGCCHSCNSLKRNRVFIEWVSMLPTERQEIVMKIYKKKHGCLPQQYSLGLKYAA